MLERVALHQTRFRTPGVSSDARGIALGARGVALFGSLDRLVTFLRVASEQDFVEELFSSLEIRQIATSLKTREIFVSVQAESSYRMDRIASLVKLSGGALFTGTSRHFVKYRDNASPMGYDVQELLDTPADVVLYHDTFQQTYMFERAIVLRELVQRLAPFPLPASQRSVPSRVLLTAEAGLGPLITGYLFRWQVSARVGVVELPSTSAFRESNSQFFLFELRDPPERIVRLLGSVPGVRAFEPLGASAAVELGFRHPIALDACRGLFPAESLHLFPASGEPIAITPTPTLASVQSTIHHPLRSEAAQTNATPSISMDPKLSVELQLVPSTEPWRMVTASTIPASQRDWLAKLLYVIPPRTLSGLRIAFTKDTIYVLDPSGIDSVPLGLFYTEIAPRIYVPSGMTLAPFLGSTVLDELLAERGNAYVFYEPGAPTPRVIPAEAFGTVSQRALRPFAGAFVHGDRPEVDEPVLPLLEYGPPSGLPMWSETEPGGPKESS